MMIFKVLFAFLLGKEKLFRTFFQHLHETRTTTEKELTYNKDVARFASGKILLFKSRKFRVHLSERVNQTWSFYQKKSTKVNSLNYVLFLSTGCYLHS